MPKKTKQPEGISVNVEISLPGRQNWGRIACAVIVDPAGTSFTDKPTMTQLAEAVRTKVLDSLEYKIDASCTLKMPNEPHQDVEMQIANDDVLDRASKHAQQHAADALKIKVVNGREVLAALKAFQKAERDRLDIDKR